MNIMSAAQRDYVGKTEFSPGSGSPREAAVALILSGPEHELLLIQRAEDPCDPWSGHMALPGGRWEAGDDGLLSTAIRETSEEVGVSLHHERCLGSLPSVQARSRVKTDLTQITPFVFRLDADRPPTVANHEVAEVVWVPLLDLHSPERKAHVTMAYEGSTYRFPAIAVGQNKVWGLTYSIISSLLSQPGDFSL